ncbi:unnamed protein product [Choristocarpus tenellus]
MAVNISEHDNSTTLGVSIPGDIEVAKPIRDVQTGRINDTNIHKWLSPLLEAQWKKAYAALQAPSHDSNVKGSHDHVRPPSHFVDKRNYSMSAYEDKGEVKSDPTAPQTDKREGQTGWEGQTKGVTGGLQDENSVEGSKDTKEILNRGLQNLKHRVFVCGRAGFTEKIEAMLKNLQVHSDHVVYLD